MDEEGHHSIPARYRYLDNTVENNLPGKPEAICV